MLSSSSPSKIIPEVRTIDQVEVGDKALTETGEYEIVYSVDHSHPTKPTEFLQIYCDVVGSEEEKDYNIIHFNNNKNNINEEAAGAHLEVSSRHMVFLEEEHNNNKHYYNPVPANSLRVGDKIKTIHGQQQRCTVEKISVVTRNGLYNILTTSGTIVVGGSRGLVVSTYSTVFSATTLTEHFLDSDSAEESGSNFGCYFNFSGRHHQLFFNMVLRPYSYACSITAANKILTSFELCSSNNNNGQQQNINRERIPISELAINIHRFILSKQQNNKMIRMILHSLLFTIARLFDLFFFLMSCINSSENNIVAFFTILKVASFVVLLIIFRRKEVRTSVQEEKVEKS